MKPALVRRWVEELRHRIEDQCRIQLSESVRAAKARLLDRVREWSEVLSRDLDARLAPLGGELGMAGKLKSVERALDRFSVPPVFVYLPLQQLRALKWPRRPAA
jgi:hypothetical protein